jgi:hypothetical protein
VLLGGAVSVLQAAGGPALAVRYLRDLADALDAEPPARAPHN